MTASMQGDLARGNRLGAAVAERCGGGTRPAGRCADTAEPCRNGHPCALCGRDTDDRLTNLCNAADMADDAPIGVLLGADSLVGTRTGVGRLTLEVARLLRQSPAVGELALLVGGSCLPAHALEALPRPPGGSGIARRLGAVLPGATTLHASWQRRRMHRLATPITRRMGGRVVYHEANFIARPFDGVTVVTVHDLSWLADPSWHPAKRVAWLERRLPGTLAQASRFVSVSDFTAHEMTRWLGIDRSRIDVVRPGVSGIFRPLPQHAAGAALRRFDLTDRGYTLAVSTLEPRKNFDRLLAAHAMLPPALRQRFPLVIAGGHGWGDRLTSDLADRARRSGTLRLIGRVTDDDLVALYARCAVFAYPSLYEGFGLPVLEAMACGAPVAASCTTAVGETAGDAALLFNPQDVAAVAATLGRVLDRRGPGRGIGSTRSGTYGRVRPVAADDGGSARELAECAGGLISLSPRRRECRQHRFGIGHIYTWWRGACAPSFLQPPGRPVSDHQPGGYADQPPEHTGHDASGRDSCLPRSRLTIHCVPLRSVNRARMRRVRCQITSQAATPTSPQNRPDTTPPMTIPVAVCSGPPSPSIVSGSLVRPSDRADVSTSRSIGAPPSRP